MAGDTSEAARRVFADSLVETLHGKEADTVKPFKCLDEGVAGYVFDLLPLRKSLLAADLSIQADSNDKTDFSLELSTSPRSSTVLRPLADLLRASLASLSPSKPRIVTGTQSPHEVLRLIQELSVDIFDTHWAQEAADWGIALDFVFPASSPQQDDARSPRLRQDGLRDIGHNLYDTRYAMDFSDLGSSTSNCASIASTPVHPETQLSHSSVDFDQDQDYVYPPPEPFTRAYIHHLLHTHEMSAHALLVAHNLAVLDAFFASIRAVLAEGDGDGETGFGAAVEAFCRMYDPALRVFAEARRGWAEVDYARGKGRLAREKAKLVEVGCGDNPEKVAEGS